jgi:ribosome-binding protein aMBF1 (putative translation factor)
MPPRRRRNSHKADPAIEIVDVTVTNRIQRVLHEMDMSQEECARRINLSLSQFHRIVAAGAVPKLDTAFALEAVLGTAVADLFDASIKTRPVR